MPLELYHCLVLIVDEATPVNLTFSSFRRFCFSKELRRVPTVLKAVLTSVYKGSEFTSIVYLSEARYHSPGRSECLQPSKPLVSPQKSSADG